MASLVTLSALLIVLQSCTGMTPFLVNLRSLYLTLTIEKPFQNTTSEQITWSIAFETQNNVVLGLQITSLSVGGLEFTNWA